MKERRVVFAPEAAGDLIGIYDWVAEAAAPDIAIGYIERIEAFCHRLSVASERGHLRSDVRPELRVVGFERRLTIAFTVGNETVTILRVFSVGRDWERAF